MPGDRVCLDPILAEHERSLQIVARVNDHEIALRLYSAPCMSGSVEPGDPEPQPFRSSFRFSRS